jgi:hypothetical protein
VRESPIRRHETLKHRCDQLCGFVLLTGFAREYLSIGYKIAMEVGGKFNAQLDWFVVRNGTEFQLGHRSTPIGFEDEVTRNHDAHREARADGQGRRHIQLTADDLVTGAADRVLRSFANGASDVIIIGA